MGEDADGTHEETVAAIRAEIARLVATREAQRAADSALDSLQDKIAGLQARLNPKYTLSRLLAEQFAD